MRSLFLLLSGLVTLASAVKFDLAAVAIEHPENGVRCLSQYVTKDTLVLATVNVGPGYNQRVDIEVRLPSFLSCCPCPDGLFS